MSSFLKTAIKTSKPKSSDRYKLPDDKKDHIVRIIPFAEGCWSFKIIQHWAPDPTGESQFDKSYICPRDQPKAYLLKEGQDELPTFNKECPFELRIDEAVGEMEGLGGKSDEASKKRLRFLRSLEWALKGQESYYMQILDREDPSGVRDFYAQPKLHDAILSAYTDYAIEATGVTDRDALMELSDDEIPDLFDVLKGHDILLRKTPKSTGQGHVFHAQIVVAESPLAKTPAEVRLLQKQLKDPVAMVKAQIEEQSSDIDAALEAAEQRVKLKQNSSKPIKGAEVSDDALFEGRGKPGGAGPASRPAPRQNRRNTDDDLPHLDPVDNGSDAPDFNAGDADDDEAQFTQQAPVTPKSTSASRRPGSRIADQLADLDAE